jgi:CheY-like chemotaxis protein
MRQTILLVDDNYIDNYISEQVLIDVNPDFEIIAKSSGMDALDYLKNECQEGHSFPDLIFLDINMPKMDGFGFLDELRSFPDSVLKSCNVVMLTSSNYPEDKLKAMQSPYVKHYFNKPLNTDVLNELLG